MSEKITPFLWFDRHAEEAITFYTSIFPDSRIRSIKRYPDGPLEGPMQGMEGRVLTGEFELAGQRFLALDGGPVFTFNPAISFFVNCATEAEIDTLWARLTEGGTVHMPLQPYPFSPKFGWVADRYGVSWQLSLVPRAQKITPFLMFNGAQQGRAEEAIRLYTSLFPDSAIETLERDAAGNGHAGNVKYALFRLHGCEFAALDSSIEHAFDNWGAISFYVDCETQEEVDYLWDALSAVPEAEQCGWLCDPFGIAWQIVPKALPDLLNDPDPEKANRAMQALLQMKKIDIAALERAHAGV